MWSAATLSARRAIGSGWRVGGVSGLVPTRASPFTLFRQPLAGKRDKARESPIRVPPESRVSRSGARSIRCLAASARVGLKIVTYLPTGS